jgi:tetratricopeptide (TPR) repeat protein
MRAFRMLEHLEQGSAEASRTGYTVWLSEVQAMQQPFYDYTATLTQTGWSLLAGRFAEAEQLAAQALRIGQRLQVEHVDGVFGIQMFTIRREQGRLAEVAPLVARFVTQKTGPAVWWPGLALIYSELGLRADAQQAFDRLAADNFAGLPRDGLWVTCLLYLAEACAFLGDAQRAAVLYEHLRPYAGRNIVVGFLSLCFGSASHFLGLLAATRSRWAEAEQHFQEALAMNARLEAWPWLAHTQHQYAAMLLLRGQPADRARAQRLLDEASENAGRFGMKALAAKVAASQAL